MKKTLNGSDDVSVRTYRMILEILKRDGPQNAESLALSLGVTAMAVRQHLYNLASQKLVTFELQARQVGRPAKLWRLTQDADSYFPDAHAELTVSLISSMQEAFGMDGFAKVLEARKQNMLKSYRAKLTDTVDIRKRVQEIAKIRSSEGYMASTQETGDGAMLLLENHCPICTAASYCQGLCAIEQEVFQELVTNAATVQRIEHIQAGAQRCAYVIRPNEGA